MGAKAKRLEDEPGQRGRRPGFDLTFSAPKSVSVLWALGSSDVRRKIASAHAVAVRDAFAYLEDEAALTRRGKGGVNRERTGLVAALFPQGTSRANDPDLHTHAVVLNVGVRNDGTTGSIDGRVLYHHKLTAGALYRSSLAHELSRELGVEIVPRQSWFELKGVPDSLCRVLSKRRQDIERVMRKEQVTGAAARAGRVTTSRSRSLC